MPTTSGANCTVQPMLYRTVLQFSNATGWILAVCASHSTGYPNGMRPVRLGAGRGARAGG
jgi:hypothetical protein